MSWKAWLLSVIGVAIFLFSGCKKETKKETSGAPGPAIGGQTGPTGQVGGSGQPSGGAGGWGSNPLDQGGGGQQGSGLGTAAGAPATTAAGPGNYSDQFRNGGSGFFTIMNSAQETGKSAHGKIQIYYSDNMKLFMGKPSFSAPEGTVAIALYDSRDKGRGIAVMAKRPGFDPQNGDWYYELRDETGNPKPDPAPGKIQECMSCHANYRSTDYLGGTNLGDLSQLGTPSQGSTSPQFAGSGPGRFAPDFENSPSFYTKMVDFVQGNSPHGRVKIFYSKNVENGVHLPNFGQVPVGTVAVKMFDNDGRNGVDGYAVMVKEETGYDSQNGYWSYELRDKWGDVLNGQRGKVAACIACHQNYRSSDFLAGTRLGVAGGGTTPIIASPGPGVFTTDYAQSASYFSQMSRLIPGRSGHGSVQIFYSSNIQGLIELGEEFSDVPVGTVAIKRYELSSASNDRCKPTTGVAVMFKDAPTGSNANDGWRYEIRTATGGRIDNCEASIQACQQCHAQAKGVSDYLRGTRITD